MMTMMTMMIMMMMKHIWFVYVAADRAWGLDSSKCDEHGGIHTSLLTRVYSGPPVLPLIITWTTPDNEVVNSTLEVRSILWVDWIVDIFESTISVPVTWTLPLYFVSTMSFQSPSNVVVRGTVQATNAPTVTYESQRPTSFMRENDLLFYGER